MGRRSNLSPILNVGNIITEALDKAKKGAATTNINKQTNAIIPPSIKEVDSLNAQKIIDSPELAGKWKADNQLNQKQKQIPILEEKADNLLEGKITGKEFRTEVKNVNPIEEINEIPVIPTFTDIAGSLKSNQIEKGILGLNKQIKDGTRVSSRLDIPAYEKYNKWIVSVHDAFDKKGNTDVLNGESIAYSKTIVLKDVSFKALPASASKIAAGRTDKGTIARIFGNIKNEAPESVAARAKGYLNNEEWTEIGFNPYKHGFFYNKKTGAPVSSADEVVQIGPLVLAHNVKKMTISQMKKLGPKGGLQIRAGKPIEGLKNLKETKTVFNKGGTAMKQQMEMFEDGGLRDQGDTIDPVSGNDVPSGSTQEEVRDDIPAQLSEGEFVLPADVVRFHGLEKIMALRDEAKAGLAKMEAMGQMGNSEEATMPDDMPFGMEDLDMEDEEAPKEMAEGGMVMIAGKPMKMPIIAGKQLEMAEGGNVTNTGTYQIPTNIASQPSYFQNYNQTVAPFQPFVAPTQQTSPVVAAATTANATGPSFNTLMPTVGGKRETKEYRNEAGQKMFIPFVDGKPIYPIPEGYSEFTQETVIKEEPVSQRVQTTRVQQETDDGDGNVKDPTVVRGLDGNIMSTNVKNQTPEQASRTFSNLQNQDRAKAVMTALTQSKGYTGFSKAMQQIGYLAINLAMPLKMQVAKYGIESLISGKLSNPITGAFDEFNKIGDPDMAERKKIGSSMGYNLSDYADGFGYIDDVLNETEREQRALNTAVLGGYNIGTGTLTGLKDINGKSVNSVTKQNVINFIGQDWARDDRGNIKRGDGPGEIDRNGVIYNVSGISIAGTNNFNSGQHSFSSTQARKDFSAIASKAGWRGSYSLSLELGNGPRKEPIAIAVIEAVEALNKLRGNQKSKSNLKKSSITSKTDMTAKIIDQLKDEKAFQEKTAKDSNSIVTVDDGQQVSSGTTDRSGGFSGTYNTPSNDDNNNTGQTSVSESGYGSSGGAGDFNVGGLVGKKKPKPKKMKRGGLASRK
tara:strand:+ start:2428 stop:5484 length:3057 start_codon:yes stop_codon:yes gene_type:complete